MIAPWTHPLCRDLISPDAVDVIKAMLQRQPAHRPSAGKLLQMPWLARAASSLPPMSASSTSIGSSTSLSSAQNRLQEFNDKRQQEGG
eukprot:SAG22_NODE_14779_length_365_cov_0.770677_1_plen_87_part_10